MKRLPLPVRLFVLSLASAILVVGSAQASHTIKLAKADWFGVDKFEYQSGGTWTAVDANSSAITYYGSWSAGDCSISKGNNGTLADSCKYTFTGTGIRWYINGADYDPGNGATVYIDGVSQGNYSVSASTCNEKLFEKTGLSGDNPPTVATAASASPSPATGTTDSLHVLGADDGGEANLTYSWATTGSPPASVTFSLNGTNG